MVMKLLFWDTLGKILMRLNSPDKMFKEGVYIER